MAPINAPAPVANGPTPTTDMPAPPLWQAPVFVLGVAALVAVWIARPMWPECKARRVENDLGTARQLLSRADGDAEQALQLAMSALDASADLPQRAGEAAYLAGCAHMRLAEKTDPVRAREAWLRAREALEQAARHQVGEDDVGDLAYRSAKAAYHCGEALPTVIAQLEEAVPKSGSRAEGYRLLSEAYLKLPTPDLAKALAANQKLRDVAEASEVELAAAKLQGGEILLRMGKSEEARRSLEKIGEQAAPAVLGKARLLRAQSYQQEKQWAEASRLYLAAQGVLSEPASVYYNLGICYRHLDQPQEAIKAWEKCVQQSRGPEAAAAAVALAELRLAEPALEAAVELMTLAVAQVAGPDQWTNPLIPMSRVMEVFEKGYAATRQQQRYDLMLKLLDARGKLLHPVWVLVGKGEINAEWAQVKLAANPTSAEVRKEAEGLYRLAASSYLQAIKLNVFGVPDKREFVWRTVNCLLAARDEAEAIARLEQVLQMGLEPARQGEGWYRLGELYRSAKKPEAAEKAYSKCQEYDTPFARRAQYARAMAALERGELDEVEASLVLNIKLLRWESDPEALSQSLFALGNLLYQRRDYRRVVRYLEDAMGRFKDNPEVTRARYQLADSYRQIAAQENQSFLLGDSLSPESRAHFQRMHRQWLQKAADEFAILERVLETPEGKEYLTPDLRAQVPFIAAKCWFNLGAYDKALAIYDRLIDRYTGKSEGLDALGGAVSCHAALGQIERVKQRLLQIKTTLPQMSEDVRKPWEDWLVEAVKPLQDL